MERFRAGDLDVLVATTVIEVGVDVPNATVMVVMDADRFGVSQLHQLRGRVGRDRLQAYAYLLIPADGRVDETAAKITANSGGAIKVERQFIGSEQEIIQQLVRGYLQHAKFEEEEFLPLPPGSLYLSNREFGEWKTNKKGQTTWRFNKVFKNFPRYLVQGLLDVVDFAGKRIG
mgnify:CR=1 FL=1